MYSVILFGEEAKEGEASKREVGRREVEAEEEPIGPSLLTLLLMLTLLQTLPMDFEPMQTYSVFFPFAQIKKGRTKNNWEEKVKNSYLFKGIAHINLAVGHQEKITRVQVFAPNCRTSGQE